MSDTIPFLPFQKECHDLAVDAKRYMINTPAGSGKSLISLAVAQTAKVSRLLVIPPAFLRINWAYEIDKWLPNEWKDIFIVKTFEDVVKSTHLKSTACIVGYSFFQTQKPRVIKLLSRQRWDMVILDESQYLRIWTAKRTQNVILKTCRGRDRILCLSATPLVTSAADLHPTYSILKPGYFGTFGKFARRYCNIVSDHYSETGIRYVGIDREHAKELRQRSRSFIYSKKKSEILKELPPKQIIDVPLDIGGGKIKDENVKEMIYRMVHEKEEESEIKTERERVGLKKVKEILDFIETIPRNEPLVIFAYHRKVIKELYTGVKNLGFKPRVILGGMSEKKRMKKVKDFQDGKFKRFIVSISAGSKGLNLQVARYGICAELPYSWEEFSQCSDRIHRIGSTKRVIFYKMVAIDTIDTHFNKMISDKKGYAAYAGVLT